MGFFEFAPVRFHLSAGEFNKCVPTIRALNTQFTQGDF